MINISEVYKNFGNQKVLTGFNLEIKRGETMVVIGPSGCGKSVLLKLIIGLMKPDSGEIIIDGQDIVPLNEEGLNKIRLKFGMLFQSSGLLNSLTVEENISLPLREHTPMEREEIRSRVKSTLELVGLKGVEKLYPHSLSGGMRKRVALARAIIMDPEIVLYDEPTTGLDPIRASSINHLILRLKKHFKTTSLIVTHDMESAYLVADRIAMLYEGRIVEVDSPENIKKSQNPIVKQFITASFKGPITGTGI